MLNLCNSGKNCLKRIQSTTFLECQCRIQKTFKLGIPSRFASKGQELYQPQAGPPEVRQLLATRECRFVVQRRLPSFTLEHILLTAGTLRAFSLLLDYWTSSHHGCSLIEVLPSYPLLAGAARLIGSQHGCRMLTIHPKDTTNFDLLASEVLPYLTVGSLLFLVNPGNPTGRYLDNHELSKIVRYAEKQRALVVIDQTCDIPFDAAQHCLLTDRSVLLSPSLVRIRGLSKTHLLAGYRIGYMIAQPSMIETLANRFSFCDGNVPVIINDWLLHVLAQEKDIRKMERVQSISRGFTGAIVEQLLNLPRVIHVVQPQACFYVFVRFILPAGSWAFFQKLLKEYETVLFPGTLFEVDDKLGWMRFCTGHPLEVVQPALDKIKKCLEDYGPVPEGANVPTTSTPVAANKKKFFSSRAWALKLSKFFGCSSE
eukprot:TRINITY_DN9067_c0_g1_i1.p1 TRINITY_DN9067_c0_g1~~TRINITY_DN9067_c0_g1_i1.p1  ORF type:complete len:427 (+),score=60.08 TRINITY_DN9067_c0_g1_i1:310-1590(+)